MQVEGFWDDSSAAAKVNTEHARATRKLKAFQELSADIEDLEGLVELAEEDAELADELGEQLASLERRLGALEEERLFSGPYDAGDALVTVNAGAGGTDAQDWAEMVLRMMMRWAESRDFKVELLEASAGRRRASSPRPSGRPARTPTGCSTPSRVSIALSGSRRSTPNRGARRPSRASRWHRSSRTRATSRSTPTTCRSTPTAPPAPGASTSTRPTRPCASRTVLPASSCSARTSARSRPNKDTAMKMLRAQAAGADGARAPGGDRQGEGRGRWTSTSAPRFAPTSCTRTRGQGPSHRPRDGRCPARAGRRPRRLRARNTCSRLRASVRRARIAPAVPRQPSRLAPRERGVDPQVRSVGAADRPLSRRGRRLRLPRTRPLPRPGAQGRPRSGSGTALRARRSRTGHRPSAGHPRHRRRSLADAI